jgi:hypothetical protein
MNLPRYNLLTDETRDIYYFISIGAKSKILKGIHFTKINQDPIVFNLALGDVDSVTGKLDDRVVTNNGDRDMILATSAFAIIDFCKNNKGVSVFIEGNTIAKRRLYQIGISKYIDEIGNEFDVYDLRESTDSWEFYAKNKEYKALLVKPV